MDDPIKRQLRECIFELSRDYYVAYMPKHNLIKILHDGPNVHLVHHSRLIGIGYEEHSKEYLPVPMAKHISVWKLKDQVIEKETPSIAHAIKPPDLDPCCCNWPNKGEMNICTSCGGYC